MMITTTFPQISISMKGLPKFSGNSKTVKAYGKTEEAAKKALRAKIDKQPEINWGEITVTDQSETDRNFLGNPLQFLATVEAVVDAEQQD